MTRSIQPGEHGYPDAMSQLPGSLKSAALYVRGELPAGPGLAVVGSRKPSRGALDMTTELTQAAAQEGFIIWSGGAVGIDGRAHLAALEVGARTVVVTAGGLDDPYPPEHATLYRRVVDEGGALVSLQPDGARRFTFQFTRRNYLLAGLTLATLVAQARETGGTRCTARVARRLGRPLMVVPDAPWCKKGRGSALELAIGATPIASAADLQTMLRNTALSAGAQLELFAGRRAIPHPQLEPNERTVFESMSDVPMHPDRLCDATGLPYRTVSQALLMLSLEGVVLEGPTGHFRRAR
jgi:DNA processing protein